MGKIGGNRNYGYGKQLVWAGKNALADRYGEGHYSTRASHEQRWQVFAQYMKQIGIKDTRKIDQEIIQGYANHLKTQVKNEEMKVAYAQNLLSTVNVVLQTMRKDGVLKISLAASVGNRSNVRTTVPKTLQPFRTDEPMFNLRENVEERTALVVQLCRTFGLRFKEASLLDANRTLKEAKRYGRINITEGTKVPKVDEARVLIAGCRLAMNSSPY